MNRLTLLLVLGMLFGCCNGYGQDTLTHRNLTYYIDAGLANSPLLKENVNALTLNRLDSLINIAINKPYVQAVGQYLYAPAGTNWGYDVNTTNGGGLHRADSGQPKFAVSAEPADSE